MKGFIGELRIWICNFIISKIPSHTIRDFYYRKIMQFRLSKKSAILLGCRFNCAGNFCLGENSVVNQYCYLDNRGKILIEDNVTIGPMTSFLTASHDLDSSNFTGVRKEIVIKQNCFIGARSIILGGVCMEVGSATGAGSVLSKSTEAYGFYLGNPAILKRTREVTSFYKQQPYKRLFH